MMTVEFFYAVVIWYVRWNMNSLVINYSWDDVVLRTVWWRKKGKRVSWLIEKFSWALNFWPSTKNGLRILLNDSWHERELCGISTASGVVNVSTFPRGINICCDFTSIYSRSHLPRFSATFCCCFKRLWCLYTSLKMFSTERKWKIESASQERV